MKKRIMKLVNHHVRNKYAQHNQAYKQHKQINDIMADV